MAKVMSIERLIVGNWMFLIGQVVPPLKFKLIHMVSVAFMELIVVSGTGSFGWDFMVIFGWAGDLRNGDYFMKQKGTFFHQVVFIGLEH
jgi:hypothetical protein